MLRHVTTAAVLFLSFAPAYAQTAVNGGRVAVIAGNNSGNPDDPVALRYAQADAAALFSVLTTMGGFSASSSSLLQGGSASDLLLSVEGARNHLAAAGGKGSDTVFLLYYSGHAGTDGLHLGESVLAGNELKKLVDEVPAAVKVVIVDACHSGALVFLKGATQVEPFLVGPGALGRSRGTVYLVSSGVSEKSQETPELGHSIFTYWLLSGLRGAADTSGDGWVSLPELWEYARSGTALTSTSTGLPQRPMWQVNLTGRDNVRLTSLHEGRSGATLQFPAFGHYWLFNNERVLVTEVNARLPGRQVLLAPGTYLVRRVQGGDHLLETEVSLGAGKTVVLPILSMRKVPYVRLASKGRGGSNWFRQGPQALVHYHGETLEGLGGLLGGGLAWTVIAGRFWLVPRLLFGASSYEGRSGRIELRETELDLSIDYGIDLDRFILRPRLVGGLVLSQQQVTGVPGGGFDRRSLGFQGGGGVVFTFIPFRGRAHLDLGLEATGYVYRYEDSVGDLQWRVAPVFKVIAGLGYVL